MRVCIPVRRSSSVRESSSKAVLGDVVVASLVLMHWVGISVLRLDESVSSLFSMKKLLSGIESGMSNGCKTCKPCNSHSH